MLIRIKESLTWQDSHPTLEVSAAAEHLLKGFQIAEPWTVPELDAFEFALFELHSFAFSALSFSSTIIPT